MSVFSIGFRTTATTNAVLELIAGASDRCRVREIGVTLGAATETPIGIGFPAAKGVTPTSPVTLLSENPGDGSTCGISLALGWATPPTSPAYFFRRATIPAGAFDALVWTWPKDEGLLVLPSTTLVLWLFATGAALDGWVKVEQ